MRETERGREGIRVAGIVVVAIRNLERASFYLVWKKKKQRQKQMERERERGRNRRRASFLFRGPSGIV